MSNLTRIKNNQITDSTILANTKIVPGSIVGSLFNANLTMTSDVTITGNLTVQGSSTYLTVASTNTYVNDPLLVLNNAFSGTNTYDVGLLFNRGNQATTALIWNEDTNQFELTYTTDDGTGYGTINNSGYANLKVGNITVAGISTVGSLSTTGDLTAVGLTLSGDAAINGGDLTTSASTFNLLNTPTVINAFTEATDLELGHTTGTATINNPILVGTQTSQDLYNTTATTLNFAGAATALTVGATSGTLNLRNANIWLPNATTIDGAVATVGLLNNATTLTFANAASTLSIGATTGTLTLRNATVTTPGQIVSTRAGSATTGGGQLFLNGSTSNRIDWNANGFGPPVFTTRSDGTKVVLYPALSGSSVDYAIGIDAATMWSSVPENGDSFNFKWYGAETLVANLSGTGNFTTVGDVAVNGGDLTTTATTFNLINATATTVNFAGAATTVNIGAASGTTNIKNNLDVDLTLNARDINSTVIGNVTPATGKFTNIYDTALTGTRVTFVGAGNVITDSTSLTFDNVSNILDVDGLRFDGGNAIIKTTTTDANLVLSPNGVGVVSLDTSRLVSVSDPVDAQDAVTLSYLQTQINSGVTNIQSDDSDITITDDGTNPGIITANVDAVSVFAIDANTTSLYSGFVTVDNLASNVAVDGSVHVASNVTLVGDLAVNGGDITTTAATFNLANANATTVDAFKAATDLEIGATSGTLTINNPTVVGTQTTQSVFNTTATTVNAFGAATTITIAATTGTTTVRNNLTATGNINIDSTEQSTNSTTGALIVDGGVGVAKNLNVGGDVVITGNLQVDGAVTTVNTATLDVEDLNITVAKGAGSSSAANGAGLTVDGASATLLYTHATTSWDLNKTTRVTATTAATNNTEGALQVLGGAGIAQSLYARDINATVIGNVTPAAANVTTFTSTGTTTLGLTTATAINSTPIGNATASSGSFTTLISSGVTEVTNATSADSQGGGAFRVTGGASVGGNLWVGGNINITGSSYVLTTTSGVFYGDTNGFGAVYAGVTGYTPLPQTVVQTSASYNGYVQNNFENLSTGVKASTDWVATAGDGSDTDHYIDMGITTVNWDGTQDNSLTNAVGTNDGYLYVQGNIATGQGGNLTIGASTPGTKQVKVIVGGNTASNISAVFTNPNTPSTNTTTGALIVTGGVGVSGNLNANNIGITNSLSATNLTLSSDIAVNGGDITTTATTATVFNTNATTVNAFGAATTLSIGATSGTTTVNNNLTIGNGGELLTVNGSMIVEGGVYGNVTTTQFGSVYARAYGPNAYSLVQAKSNDDTTGIGMQSFSGANGLIYSNSGISFAVGATVRDLDTPTGGTIYVTISNTGIVTLGNDIISSTTTQNVFNTVATTVNAFGAATTMILGATTGTANIRNATTNIIGNATVGGTLGVTGNTSVLAETDSTSTVTGALTVAGGVGIAKTVHVGGNTHIASTKVLTVGKDIASGVYPESVAQFTSNANLHSSVSIQNLSSGLGAASEFTAINNTGSNAGGYISVGITSTGFNNSSRVHATDGYMFTDPSAGNLVIGSSHDLLITAGGLGEAATIAKFDGSNGNLTILSAVESVSPISGAITTVGGIGVGGNLYVAKGAVLNEQSTPQNFTVKGVNTTTLIHADSNHGAVVIGGSNATPTLGAVVKFNSSDSIRVPVGSTADRPSNTGNVDVAGMVRFNTTNSSLEFYNGTDWAVAGSDSTFTIITSEQFTGNGLANVYALSSSTTTNGTVVSINGILQIPTLSYSITGSTLTFSENPADGDLIDVRILTTTQTAGQEVSSSSGFNTFTPADGVGSSIYSGSSAKNLRVTMTEPGVWTYKDSTKTAYDVTATQVSSASSAVIVDQFATADYSSAKYIVQIKQSSANVQIMEALVVHDSGNAYVSTYGVVDTNGSLGTLTANVVSGNVRLYYTSSSLTNSNVKVATTYIV